MARPSRSLGLRPLRAADVDRLAAWLPDVAAATGCLKLAKADGLRELIADPAALTTSDASGFIRFKVGSPDVKSAQVGFVAVQPDHRRLGIGGRMALSGERRLNSNAQRVFVQVPESIGLALYFWLRLGYRPLTASESPRKKPNSGSLWMVRDIT